MSEKVAREKLWPSDTNVVVRVCFLYVGQGSSVLVLVRNNQTWKTLVFDSNRDKKSGGIDVARLLEELLDGEPLYAFVNTHPHDDHLSGVKEIGETVDVENVWHSGHKPSKSHGSLVRDLDDLIAAVKKKYGAGAIRELCGSKSSEALFDGELHVLAPAKHVTDDIEDEDDDERYRRIHEQCVVAKIGKEGGNVLITGDADLVAFRDNIAPYHKERLGSHVLDASHHGSRSFFKKDEEDEPYLDALEAIAPEYVVISAPTQKESRHGHPHSDAVELYEDQVGADGVLHTGKDRHSFFFDIDESGSVSGPYDDDGDLQEEYGLDDDEEEEDKSGGSGGGSRAKGPFVSPSGPPDVKPRKYARG